LTKIGLTAGRSREIFSSPPASLKTQRTQRNEGDEENQGSRWKAELIEEQGQKTMIHHRGANIRLMMS
jgi:hypothetical protein